MSHLFISINSINQSSSAAGTHGGAFGWGTELQAGRTWGRLRL